MRRKGSMKPILLGKKRAWSRGKRFMVAMLTGGIGYGALEVVWRGYTHISMILAGGFCFTVILLLNHTMRNAPFLCRCFLCTGVVVLTEFLVGLLVNRILHLGVWDYSGLRFNLLGQICLEFSLLWFLLCCALSLVMTVAFRKGKI